MSADHHARGGAAVAVLSRMDAWEADVVLSLRLWCEGPQGQAQVWSAFRRPLVRHDVGCACVGADEAIFLNLIRTAADGHLTDAALIATLLTGPAEAERIALLAGEVGACARRMNSSHDPIQPEAAPNVVRLH